MILQNEPIKFNYKDLFKKISLKFIGSYKMDICLLIVIQEHLNYATVLDSNIAQKSIKTDFGPIDLTDARQTINFMRAEKKVIITEDENKLFKSPEYNPLIMGMAQEMYIPIFSQNNQDDVIGCFYLGCKKNNKTFGGLYNNEDFTNGLSVINCLFHSLYSSYKMKKEFFIYVNTVCEFYKNHCQRINHPFNVAYWSLLIAKQLNLEEEYLFELYIAAILHDIGILLVPQHIVNKVGKLSDHEYNLLKQHTVYGYNLIKDLKYSIGIDNLDDIIRHHHERYDGNGYPDGLKAEEIPLLSRIIAVADATDAMLSDRIFRLSLPLEKVVEELSNNKEKQFDPDIADIMIQILVKQNEDIKSIIGPVTWGSLVITTKNNCFNYQGNIIKKAFGYEFFSDEIDLKHSKKFKINEITDCSLIIERSGKFYEYSVLPGKTGINNMFIKDIQYKPSSQYFSMYWNLAGEIKENDVSISDIAIKKIGGNLITFYSITQTELKTRQIYTLKIQFEDGEIIHIPGENIRTYESGSNIFYDFEFNNLNESIRDRIFKQIYKKQTEIRQLMWKASYYAVANNLKLRAK
jgi:HD-GYP domain-containing protein (c-di-GMP phosphodiesterase class II)